MAKKIVIITYNPEKVISGNIRSGVDKFSLLLYKLLQEEGFSVTVVGPKKFISKFPPGLEPLGFFASQIPESVDLVVANSPFGWNVPRRVPLIWVAHGTRAKDAAVAVTLKQRLWYGKVAATIEKLSCKRANYVVAVSEDTNKFLRNFYGREANQVILNAVELKSLHQVLASKPPNSPSICLFVGSTWNLKGYDIVLRIAEQLKGAVQVKAVIGGKPKKGLTVEGSDMVQHFYNLSQSQVQELYEEANFAIFPSRGEGCSYAIIEAWACGLPTLLSPVGHIPEVMRKYPWLKEWVIDSFSASVWKEKVQNVAIMVSATDMRKWRERFHGLAEDLHNLKKWKRKWRDIISKFV